MKRTEQVMFILIMIIIVIGMQSCDNYVDLAILSGIAYLILVS